VARPPRGLGLWLLGGALIAVPIAVTAPSLRGDGLEPLGFFFGLAFAGLMAAAAVVAFLATGSRAVAVPVAALLAAVGVVTCVVLFEDSRGAVGGWVGAVVVAVVGVRIVDRRP
jgi:hypothetical protein